MVALPLGEAAAAFRGVGKMTLHKRKETYMGTDQANEPFLVSMATRVTSWGPTITGLLGLILAVNAALSDEYIGAGVCLVASGLAFGVMAYAFLRK